METQHLQQARLDWLSEAVEQLDWHWREHLRPRLDGLTDDEYLWEPVPGAWSIRPRDEAVTTMAAGAGDVVADFEHPEPSPAPITTIAWRMAHLCVGIFGTRAADHFGAFGGPGTVTYPTTDWPLTAAGGLRFLDETHAAWMDGVRSLDAEGAARPCGPAEGPFADHPLAALVMHINREAIHHGAEIALLRDLYAVRGQLTGGGGAR